MMRLLLSALFVTGLIVTCNAQKNTFGLSVGIGNGIIMKQELTGGASHELNTGLSIGLQYTRKLTNKLHLMTGVNIYNNSVTVTPNVHPDIDQTPTHDDVNLIYIPILVKVDLAKYFFINGGLIGDIDITGESDITDQSGLGTSVGIGTEFSIGDKFGIQVNPYLNFHGLMLTHGENYPERILDAGIKLNFILKK